MTGVELQRLLDRPGSLASEIQQVLERGEATASERQQQQLMGVRRGLKRGVLQQRKIPDERVREEVAGTLAALAPRITRELPGWRVGCRRNDRGEQTFVLTRRRPLGVLSGCSLYGLRVEDLEGVARLLEQVAEPGDVAA